MSQQSLVLVGGGHSHAIALNLWGQKPLPNVDLTLISDVENTPYSGMLPAYVAGFYSYEETHINLPRLAKKTGAKLIIDPAIGLDLNYNRVLCKNNSPINFDFLSLDIGSTPDTISVPGTSDYAIPAKPVPLFLSEWENLLHRVKNKDLPNPNIVIVGGGAGGVELALNIHSRLKRETNSEIFSRIKISLIHRGNKILSSHNNSTSDRLQKILKQRNIQLYLNSHVNLVEPKTIIYNSGLKIKYDYLFWVTQASVPHWIKNSNLTTNKDGFILVTNTLQSLSHPHIFATGDIATIQNYPRPKAGVFAVRQGKPLFTNWQNIIQHQTLQNYIPQKKYLSLIGTGNKQAIASWGSFTFQSSLLWTVKDYIDRKFMKQFY